MGLIDDICAVVRNCGNIILEAKRDDIGISAKAGEANFVTTYDTKVQEELKRGLMQITPDAVFVGEEGSEGSFAREGYCYIVDPIDGTTNFIKDYHLSCISVALLKDGKAYIGVVYNPYLDEMFTAMAGEGAFLNGKEIHVSRQPLENGLVLFGTAPYYKELNRKSFDMAYEYFQKAMDIRRSGSAALDLCTIAAGRAELYFELRLCPWDHAAGSLIVKEAGGIVTTVEGEELPYDRPCSVLARNKE